MRMLLCVIKPMQDTALDHEKWFFRIRVAKLATDSMKGGKLVEMQRSWLGKNCRKLPISSMNCNLLPFKDIISCLNFMSNRMVLSRLCSTGNYH